MGRKVASKDDGKRKSVLVNSAESPWTNKLFRRFIFISNPLRDSFLVFKQRYIAGGGVGIFQVESFLVGLTLFLLFSMSFPGGCEWLFKYLFLHLKYFLKYFFFYNWGNILFTFLWIIHNCANMNLLIMHNKLNLSNIVVCLLKHFY